MVGRPAPREALLPLYCRVDGSTVNDASMSNIATSWEFAGSV